MATVWLVNTTHTTIKGILAKPHVHSWLMPLTFHDYVLIHSFSIFMLMHGHLHMYAMHACMYACM